MHLPDHFLDPQTTVAITAAAGVVVALAVRRSRDELAALTACAPDEVAGRAVVRARVRLAAATTALVFGLQMLNFPVASGTSGHLLGGALAASLLGPALGLLSVTAVVLVQALVFADGGLTAIGPNVLLIAVVGTLVGWATARLVHHGVRGRRAVHALACSAAAGGLVSVVSAAALFALLFAAGGTVPVPAGRLVSQMVGVHLLIGVGEAAITAGVVSLAHAVAPGIAAPGAAPGPVVGAAPSAVARRGALTIAMIAAVALSPFAASTPDGLEATARTVGFADAARDHAWSGAPLADYGAGSDLFIGITGALGVALCAALTTAVLRGIRAGVSPA
ncbi:energy-coupling factor ABC transporter permease [uncultured Cellulomonas sp.]|uniref:energy-coupling factor ABC transporter permease n=1 Tax=uncultured Cellulomonas sp. TaxID=189682 RepID=UPI0026232C51|nr:energy-coupling factor ABC transporter permease [uncultured Cellulomonas sp.]